MKSFGRKLRKIGIWCALGFATGVILIASPLGRLMDRQLTVHFRQMNERREGHRLTWADGVQCRVLYNGIALGGRLLSPEGGAVIYHYLYGEGKDLWLSPDYIQRSSVITRSLALLREGESRRFTFRQADDFRLSFAVNPFNLRRKDGGYVLLWQKIEFDAKPYTYTTLDYGIGSFRLPDALIYSMRPRAYTVYCQWRSPS
jgi:hypothetical protein